jgi:(p)ppGpp synthase/HD superfamily hydrolase
MNLLERAILLAAQAHQGQVDKNGTPYILHPLRVMFRLTEETDRVIAVLHDVVEDTDWTLDRLRAEGFPEEVVEAVDCLTRREGESYDDFVARAAANPIARRVKQADLEDNMDPKRLDRWSAKDAERFERYHRAWRFITGGESQA